ncbi:MAG: FKBP-type peptidyl-prolyl cis-trans isomerase [Pseudomonadota bacterium]|nr:FKBP-type peptidyl-prolyl cis-trans isomerase [Pseudomonadota bacterium]|tara:strand:- start:156 stop:905 length:750 start_codon:yes stop_codon:yes gene_type:complete
MIKSVSQLRFPKLKIIAIAATLMVSGFASAAQEDKNVDSLDPEFKKVASYSLGARYAQAIQADFGEELDLNEFVKGFKHVVNGEKLDLTPEELQKNLAQLQQIRTNRLIREQNIASEKNKTASDEFLDKNKEADGVKTTESGLQYKVLKSGEGDAKPTRSDKVTVHYHGTLIDGTVFDSSVERGTPATFPVGGVIPGWTEALQLMTPGDKWVLYIPSDLAYGERGTPGGPIGPNQALVFEVELLDINGQ